MYKLLAAIIILLFTTSLFAQNSKDPDDINKQALRSFERGEYEEAISGFTKVIELTSSLRPKDRSLGANFAEAPTTIDNMASNDRITVIDPRTAAAYVNRGKSYFASGNVDSALDDFNRALTISPAMPAAYLCRGSAWLSKRRYDLAIADFDKAIKLDPDKADGYIARGVVKLNQGSSQAAFEDLNLAI